MIYMSGSKGDASAEIAIQYNDGYNESIQSFANDVRTPEGGMHETGFKTALTRVLNNYGIKAGIIKGEDKVSGEDCREGVTAIISVKLTDAQFEGQTKAKLGNAYIRTLVDQIVNEQLATYFEEHPQTAKIILEKAMMDVMFTIPSDDTVVECVMTKDAVEGKSQPMLIRDNK